MATHSALRCLASTDISRQSVADGWLPRWSCRSPPEGPRSSAARVIPIPRAQRGDRSDWRDVAVTVGPPPGMKLAGVQWPEAEVDLSRDWSLLMFTDGLLAYR